MTRQEKNKLIMKCLSKRLYIDIERAYDLANMAIEGPYPYDILTEDEWNIFIYYRLIVRDYQLRKEGSV